MQNSSETDRKRLHLFHKSAVLIGDLCSTAVMLRHPQLNSLEEVKLSIELYETAKAKHPELIIAPNANFEAIKTRFEDVLEVTLEFLRKGKTDGR
jgi:hypothetical protein